MQHLSGEVAEFSLLALISTFLTPKMILYHRRTMNQTMKWVGWDAGTAITYTV